MTQPRWELPASQTCGLQNTRVGQTAAGHPVGEQSRANATQHRGCCGHSIPVFGTPAAGWSLAARSDAIARGQNQVFECRMVSCSRQCRSVPPWTTYIGPETWLQSDRNARVLFHQSVTDCSFWAPLYPWRTHLQLQTDQETLPTSLSAEVKQNRSSRASTQ